MTVHRKCRWPPGAEPRFGVSDSSRGYVVRGNLVHDQAVAFSGLGCLCDVCIHMYVYICIYRYTRQQVPAPSPQPFFPILLTLPYAMDIQTAKEIPVRVRKHRFNDVKGNTNVNGVT